MLYELTYMRYCKGGAYCRVRYKPNRAVTVLVPTEQMPFHRYGAQYEFDERADAMIKAAIKQHEDELVESKRLG